MSIPALENYNINAFNQNHINKPEWQFDPQRAVLLIHDLQEYFVGFYGRDGDTVKKLLTNIVLLKNTCKKLGIPCIYTAQPGNQKIEDRALLTDFWGPGLKDDCTLTDIVNELTPDESDTVFTKWRYSAFQKNDLHSWLKDQGRDQILICGIYAHIGILATSLEAFMLDIQPFVVADAVADFSEDDHNMAITYIAERCGVITNLHSLTSIAKPEVISNGSIVKDIAKILMLDDSCLEREDNLMDFGMDSIRAITLINQWQNSGMHVEFSDLTQNMTLGYWLDYLSAETAS